MRAENNPQVDTWEVELDWYALTHPGQIRSANEDSFAAAPPLFAVADGMGGYAGGALAANAVTSSLKNLVGQQALTPETVVGALHEAIAVITADPEAANSGAGSTVTGIILSDAGTTSSWQVFNIGDSRVYQYYNGALTQITTDHSVVQTLLDNGSITPEEAENHPQANMITRAVTVDETPDPDFYELALFPGQWLLLCSDGLTKELTDAGIAHFLGQAKNAKQAVKTLVAKALENAGRDNITVIAVRVQAINPAA